MSKYNKSTLRLRQEHLIYWASIGMDVALPTQEPGVYVLGYIKSGTNWLCHLLSSALDIPILEPWKMTLPTARAHIYHMHRFIPLDSVRRRTVYLMRDGRDTMVSRYFHVTSGGGIAKNKLEKTLKRTLTPNNIRENLADFIRLMQTSNVATLDYRSHILEWMKHKDKYITLRYEMMLQDTSAELRRAVDGVSLRPIGQDKVNRAVELHDFTRLTKRKQGDEDSDSFIRKGISGDWRNYFTAEAARVFDDYAGDILYELGYEQDRNWARNI